MLVLISDDSLENPNYNDNPKRLNKDVHVRGCPLTQVWRLDDVGFNPESGLRGLCDLRIVALTAGVEGIGYSVMSNAVKVNFARYRRYTFLLKDSMGTRRPVRYTFVESEHFVPMRKPFSLFTVMMGGKHQMKIFFLDVLKAQSRLQGHACTFKLCYFHIRNSTMKHGIPCNIQAFLVTDTTRGQPAHNPPCGLPGQCRTRKMSVQRPLLCGVYINLEGTGIGTPQFQVVSLRNSKGDRCCGRRSEQQVTDWCRSYQSQHTCFAGFQGSIRRLVDPRWVRWLNVCCRNLIPGGNTNKTSITTDGGYSLRGSRRTLMQDWLLVGHTETVQHLLVVSPFGELITPSSNVLSKQDEEQPKTEMPAELASVRRTILDPIGGNNFNTIFRHGSEYFPGSEPRSQDQRSNRNNSSATSVCSTHINMVRSQPLHPDIPCLGLGNLAVSQSSHFLRMALQPGTEGMLQLNALSIFHEVFPVSRGVLRYLEYQPSCIHRSSLHCAVKDSFKCQSVAERMNQFISYKPYTVAASFSAVTVLLTRKRGNGENGKVLESSSLDTRITRQAYYIRPYS
ncbi:hypothetical protein CLF_101281 [Clonorchis sinensis]|uniref:Uncharacterized protein n=1 Tax=Clonorchis sinensis TaxID=79923 RepID=G7Y5E7_CLOSI|nr:hypothetical protein CLF_101281 [Clonorchis sinensis]